MRHVGFLLVASLFACGGDPPARGPWKPAVPEVPGVQLERIFAVRAPDGAALVGGFDGAAAPGLELIVRGGGESARVIADPRGRLRGALPASAEVTVERSDGGFRPVTFAVRAPEVARRAAVAPSLGGAGSVPNDLVIAGAHGLLVRSGDDAVSPLDLERGLTAERPGIRLPSGANPYFVEPLDAAGDRAAVTAFGHHQVYVVRFSSGEVERALSVPVELEVEPPLVLPRPFDIDGDGEAETEVRRFSPRAPQSLARVGDWLLVGFSGFVSPRLDAARAPIYLPSVLVRWDLADLAAPPQVLPLPAFNLQEVRAQADGRVVAVCSGRLDYLDGDVTTNSPGAVYLVDVESMELRRSFELGAFAPTTALVFEDRVWVGSLARGVLRGLSLEGGAEREIVVNDEAVDSVFRLVDLGGGLIGVPSFNTDRLHILDAVTGELDPPPLYAPLEVGPGRPIFDGLQIVARRPGRPGVDFVGPDLFALSGIAARITPIELRQLFGP